MSLFAPARSTHRIGEIAVTLVRSPRASKLRLRVDSRTGEVVLTMPKRGSRRAALHWAQGHGDWIRARLAAIPAACPLRPGALVPLFGEPHCIAWAPERRRGIAIGEGRLVVGGPAEGMEGRILRGLRSEALALLTRETEELAAEAGLKVRRVGVGDPRSRWGSCSSEGSIRYSWRLILAPPFVRRATVAHEVAHLRYLDHGREFHALAARLLGDDPRPARAWLRREGAALHRIGPQA